MAVEKLSDGIRKFAADAIKLETMIKVKTNFISISESDRLCNNSQANDFFFVFFVCVRYRRKC